MERVFSGTRALRGRDSRPECRNRPVSEEPVKFDSRRLQTSSDTANPRLPHETGGFGVSGSTSGTSRIASPRLRRRVHASADAGSNPAARSKRETDALQEFVARIRAALGSTLREVRLFGSEARRDARAESDLDVLIVATGECASAEDLAIDIAFDINVANGIFISPRVVTAESLAHPVWRTTLCFQTVTQEGVPL
jgi:predicted nucleotidyltransferase